MSKLYPMTYEEKYEELSDQCVSIREFIPKVVNHTSTDSMVNSPSEVLYFAELYIKELQEELKQKNN